MINYVRTIKSNIIIAHIVCQRIGMFRKVLSCLPSFLLFCITIPLLDLAFLIVRCFGLTIIVRADIS